MGNVSYKDVSKDTSVNSLIKAVADENIRMYNEIIKSIDVNDYWNGAPIYYHVIIMRLYGDIEKDKFIEKLFKKTWIFH